MKNILVSELLEHLREMFSLYYMHSDKLAYSNNSLLYVIKGLNKYTLFRELRVLSTSETSRISEREPCVVGSDRKSLN